MNQNILVCPEISDKMELFLAGFNYNFVDKRETNKSQKLVHTLSLPTVDTFYPLLVLSSADDFVWGFLMNDIAKRGLAHFRTFYHHPLPIFS